MSSHNGEEPEDDPVIALYAAELGRALAGEAAPQPDMTAAAARFARFRRLLVSHAELLAVCKALVERMDEPSTNSLGINRRGEPEFKGSFLTLTEKLRRLVMAAEGGA